MQKRQATPVWSLGWENYLESEMATLSSILAWKIPWTEEPGRQRPMGSKKPDTTELIHTYVALSAVPEINITHYYTIWEEECFW